jgi:hypothetical protein
VVNHPTLAVSAGRAAVCGHHHVRVRDILADLAANQVHARLGKKMVIQHPGTVADGDAAFLMYLPGQGVCAFHEGFLHRTAGRIAIDLFGKILLRLQSGAVHLAPMNSQEQVASNRPHLVKILFGIVPLFRL